jgi:hypothetical protein
MADMLASGLAYLTDQLTEFAAQDVTYTRGTIVLTVPAVLGKKLLKLYDDIGVARLEWTDMDFLIAAADLIVGGLHSLPARGDLVTITLADGTQSVFEVAPYGPSDPPWRWSDPNQTMLRVHTKQIQTQVPAGATVKSGSDS